jgi:transcriptional regulator with XRE-family HTH domain
LDISYLKDTRYNRGMSMIAAGAYLWELRDAKKLSREELADAIGTNDVQVMRIEKGEIDTRGSLLLRFIHKVNGDFEEVVRLMDDPTASEEEGRRRALEWANRKVEERKAGQHDPLFEEVLNEMAAEYRRRPTVLGQIRAFIAGYRGRGNDDVNQ